MEKQRIIIDIPKTVITSRDGTPHYLADRDLESLAKEYFKRAGIESIPETWMLTHNKNILVADTKKGVRYVVHAEHGPVTPNIVLGGEGPRGVAWTSTYTLEGSGLMIEAEVSVAKDSLFMPSRIELFSMRNDSLPYWFIIDNPKKTR